MNKQELDDLCDQLFNSRPIDSYEPEQLRVVIAGEEQEMADDEAMELLMYLVKTEQLNIHLTCATFNSIHDADGNMIDGESLRRLLDWFRN